MKQKAIGETVSKELILALVSECSPIHFWVFEAVAQQLTWV